MKKFAVLIIVLFFGLKVQSVAQSLNPVAMKTAWGEQVTPENAWGQYPRPQMVRSEWLTTCLEIAGASYPDTFDGRTITPTTGRSFLAAALNETAKPHEVIFWEHQGAAALRQGDWKLVRLGRKAPWELYNLASDKAEVNNLVETNPDKLKEMARVWDEMAQKQNVYASPSKD